MQKIKPKEIHQKEDEIDFKIVWLLIIESKRFIVLATLALTIATAMFVYFRPTYISSATIELARYENETRDCHSIAEHNFNLLNDFGTFRFIENSNCEDNYSLIDSSSTMRGLLQATYPQVSNLNISYSSPSHNKILINVHSNQENTETILLEIVTFIKDTHQLKIDVIKESRERLFTLYNNKYNDALSTLNNKTIGLEALKKALIEKLSLLNKVALSGGEKTIDELEIVVTEQHLETIEIELSALSLQKMYDTDLVTLNEKRKAYKALLSASLYQNSELVGSVVTGLHKKKDNTTVLRSFFIGLILSLLIVLFKSRKKIF